MNSHQHSYFSWSVINTHILEQKSEWWELPFPDSILSFSFILLFIKWLILEAKNTQYPFFSVQLRGLLVACSIFHTDTDLISNYPEASDVEVSIKRTLKDPISCDWDSRCVIICIRVLVTSQRSISPFHFLQHKSSSRRSEEIMRIKMLLNIARWE